jgi:hypothetical protein
MYKHRTDEEVEKLFAKFRPREEQVIKEGMDCLEKHMGRFDAQHFLTIYYIKRVRESRGKDYTKWRQENPPEDDPELMALVDSDDELDLQMEPAYVTNKVQMA